MTRLELRKLASIMLAFNIPYQLGWGETEMKEAIYNKIIENPDVTDMSEEVLTWLKNNGYTLINEEGKQI